MKYILGILLTLTAIDIVSQTMAVTEYGKEVILNHDGSWNYLEDFSDSNIETNFTSYNKNSKSSFLVRSQIASVGFWINTIDWKFNKDEDYNSDSEYAFEYKHGDLYALAIVEELEIPLDRLAKIALDNAKDVMSELQVISQEYRYVNGIKVLFLQFMGSIEGIKITYLGYYYSDESGSVQLITFTGSSLFDKYQSAMEEFLNGLTSL
jgi:hypothetical protein